MSKHPLIDRAERAILALGWNHPFFLPAAARVQFYVDLDGSFTDTAAADPAGKIYLTPGFADPLSDKQLQGLLAHEVSHLLFDTSGRRGNRAHPRWNRASDRAINAILRQAGIELPPDGLYPLQGNEEMTAEEQYDDEPEDPDFVARPCRGCGLLAGDGSGPGEDETDDGAGGMAPLSPDDLAQVWREIAAQSVALSRSAGTTAGATLARIVSQPPPKVRWSSVLRGALSRAAALHGVDDRSWTRRSRRSGMEIILPGGISVHTRVAIVIDSSGSVSDQDLTQAVSETCAIVQSSGIPSYLVIHDSEVQWQGWIKPGVKTPHVAGYVKGRGGTVFQGAYEAVAAAGRFDVFIHLTDGENCGPWPAFPKGVKRKVVALVGYKARHLVPDGVKIVEVDS